MSTRRRFQLLRSARGSRPTVVWLGLLCAVTTPPPPAALAQSQFNRSTPELLVDLARDYGLRRAGRQTAADVQHVRVLLEAAIRLDPNQADAWRWLCDLGAGGDAAGLRENLAGLLAADAGHEAAYARWLEFRLGEIQTVEQRRRWLESQLDEVDGNRLKSLVHTNLARVELQQFNRSRAGEHIQQAAELDPLNPDPAFLALSTLPADAQPAEKLEAMLAALRFNPLDVELAWGVADLLEAAGLSQPAHVFYEHAASVHQAAGGAMPADRLVRLAANAIARGDEEAALRYAQGVLRIQPIAPDHAFFIQWLFTRTGHIVEATTISQRLSASYAAIRDPAELPVNTVAQAAWFYCVYEARPERALMLAENAASRAPGDPFVTRVLGWAQALNLRNDQARATLEPIAQRDAYATYQIAKILKDAGDTAAANAVLQALRDPPRVGLASDLLRSLDLGAQPASAPAPEAADLLAALSGFERELLEFARAPQRFVAADVRIADLAPRCGEPWRAEFRLLNRSRFPITLGPDGMLNPVFLVSIQMEGDRLRRYENLLTVGLDRYRVIPPGGTIFVQRTLDVGPPRLVSRMTPQQLQRVTVTAILDPQQQEDGSWKPSISGQTVRGPTFNRLPLVVSPEGWNALFAALRDGPDSDRFRAIEMLAQALGERQRAAGRQLAYRPEPVPADRIHAALLTALGAESWELRARTLESLMICGLDAQLLRAAQTNLAHPHWLVRLMALRLLARQGESFLESARDLAANDADELVRSLAASYVERWAPPQRRSPASRPATQPAESPEAAPGGSSR